MRRAREQAQHAANSYDTSVQWVQHYEHSEDHVAFGMNAVFAVRCTWVNGCLPGPRVNGCFCPLVHFSMQKHIVHFTFRSHHIRTSYHFIQGTHWANQKTGLSPCAKLLGREMDTGITSQQKKNTSESVKKKQGGSPKQTTEIEFSFVVPVAHALWGNFLMRSP